jgi:hypothetical protein
MPPAPSVDKGEKEKNIYVGNVDWRKGRRVSNTATGGWVLVLWRDARWVYLSPFARVAFPCSLPMPLVESKLRPLCIVYIEFGKAKTPCPVYHYGQMKLAGRMAVRNASINARSRRHVARG